MTDEDRDFEQLLEFLRDSRGFDFTGYKRTSLMRRVNKRMELVGIDSHAAYLDHLQVHPDEFTSLFNFILINVTAFFRDEPIWSYIADEVIPAIIRGKAADEPIRVWDAGCASGEEAFTLALLFADALGKDEFGRRMKIYATDVDTDVLEEGRQATYTQKQIEPIPEHLVKEHFQNSQDGAFALDKDLRRGVVFGRHDLVTDAPISRIDLLSCRNTLMYFNADVQAKILESFRFALNGSGYLLLGKSEMLFTRVRSFTPVDLKRRVFRPADEQHREQAPAAERGEHTEPDADTQRAAFEASPIPQLLVDVDGRLVWINGSARSLFRLSRDDVGRGLQELEISYRPVELRSQIEEAHRRGSSVTLTGVDWATPAGSPMRLDVEVVPLFDTTGSSLGTIISFSDMTQYFSLEEELNTSHQELETAMEELQSTNEELETTNEELQSTNEELETMNEELQSTNEELSAVNEEARERSTELDDANMFLEAVLMGVRAGMIVVDKDLRVRAWNEQAEDLWGLRADEVVGHPLSTLDIGLPVDELSAPIRAALAGSSQTVDLKATSRRGRALICRVTCSPLRTSVGEIDGVILLMEEATS